MGNLNNGFINLNNLNEEDAIQGVSNSRRAYLDKLYRSYKFDPEWVRPADWLPITDPAPGEQKFVGLLGISDSGDEANRVSVRFTGAYTVDWGDGIITNHTSSSIATHTYNYASIPAGTTTSFGLRQVIVTITPQTGVNFSTVDILEVPTGFSQQSIYWLDIVLRAPFCSTLQVAGTSFNLPLLERFRVLELGNVTSGSNMFYRCFKLRVVEFPSTWTPTNTNSMFSYCNDLLYAPYINTSLTTQALSMFYACTSLKYVPKYDFTKVLAIQQLFAFCYSLEYIHDLNFPLASSIQAMFNQCFALREVGKINAGSITSLAQMFEACSALKKIGELTYTGNVTSFFRTFYNCYSLLEVPRTNGTTFNMSTATTSTGATYTFYGCRSLRYMPPLVFNNPTSLQYCFGYCESVPEINITTTASTTIFSQMCYSCSSLKKISSFNTSGATSVIGMFAECRSLLSVPALNLSNISSSTGIDSNSTTGRMCYNAVGVSSMLATGARVSINLQYCKLGRDDIVTVFNNLGTALGTQTINVRNNPGTSNITTGDLLIASGKGWTILT